MLVSLRMVCYMAFIGSYTEAVQEGWSQTGEQVCRHGAREDPGIMKIFKSLEKVV